MNRSQGIGMTSDRTRRRLAGVLRDAGIKDEAVLQVMQSVPRHMFVDEALASRAYENKALPIGHGQTISQPYIVALMTAELFAGGRRGKVLEIGTGCGYQAAVLSSFADWIFSVERIQKLHRQARDRLYDLQYRNVTCVHADGFSGLSEESPFDGILAAAASGDVPRELLEQLGPGGRLVMPVETGGEQLLIVIDRTAAGLAKREVEAVNFVPRVFGTV